MPIKGQEGTKMQDDERRRRGPARRFEFIEWRLYWEGQLNRADLEAEFGISTPQASLDLRTYREVAGDNVAYDPSAKTYLPAPGMVPRFLRVSAGRLLLQLRAWLTGAVRTEDLWFRRMPPVDMVPDLARNLSPECLRQILAAIRSRQAVEVLYQSMTNARRRRIAPHALAFDGQRWHARAWCCEREEFRDFVLSRMSEVGSLSSVTYDPADDLEWTTRVVLKLRAHPGLDPEQRRAVEHDFAMVDGRREVETRLSMAFYLIRRLNLDVAGLRPERVQLHLENRDEVEVAARTVRKVTQSKVAAKVQS